MSSDQPSYPQRSREHPYLKIGNVILLACIERVTSGKYYGLGALPLLGFGIATQLEAD